jgi:ATP-binding cassette subfamily B protein
VLIDGADVRDVDPDALRREIAVVNDDPFLFSASVAENIAYARPDASEDEIRLAAERAQAAASSRRCPTATTRRSASAA